MDLLLFIGFELSVEFSLCGLKHALIDQWGLPWAEGREGVAHVPKRYLPTSSHGLPHTCRVFVFSWFCSFCPCLLPVSHFASWNSHPLRQSFIFSEEFSIFPGRFTNMFLNDTRAFVPVASRVCGWWDEGSGQNLTEFEMVCPPQLDCQRPYTYLSLFPQSSV